MSEASFKGHMEADSVRDKNLLEMEEMARKRHIPVVKPKTRDFLQVMVKAKRPERILEIGTAVGYSTIIMALAAGEGTEVVTIEIDEDLALEAGDNFRGFGLDKQINLKIGDALEILPYLRREFELVFIDAAKGQYLNYLESLINLVPSGGLIIADNVLYRGYVQKKGKIKHKRRTMVKVLQEYIEVVRNHPLLDTSIIPLEDGISVSVRR